MTGWDGSLLSGAGRGGWITGMDLFLPADPPNFNPKALFSSDRQSSLQLGDGMDRGGGKSCSTSNLSAKKRDRNDEQ